MKRVEVMPASAITFCGVDALLVEPREPGRRIGDTLLVGAVVREALDALQTGDRLGARRQQLLERRPRLAGRGGEEVAGHEPQRRLAHLLRREPDALPHVGHERRRRLAVGVDVDDHEPAEWCRQRRLRKGATRGETTCGTRSPKATSRPRTRPGPRSRRSAGKPITIDLEPMENDLHWHDFDAVLYVLDGSVTIELDDGTADAVRRAARGSTRPPAWCTETPAPRTAP